MRNRNEQLIDAVKEGDLRLVKHLVENGADIHADSDCALRCAAINGHLEVVKHLVEKGADVHVDDDCALRYAAINGHLEVVKYLKGIDKKQPADSANRQLEDIKSLLEKILKVLERKDAKD